MEPLARVAALLFLLALGFFYPPLGLLVASAYSLFVIGFFLAGALKLRLEPLELLAFSVLASVLVSTQAVYAASLVSGSYSRETIFLVFALFSLLSPKAPPLRSFRGLKSYARVFVAAAVVFLFVFGVLSMSVWKITPNGVVNGGWNWSDFLVHLSVITTINAGIFPPQTPFFAGEPLVAHYFADFHSALIAKAGGVFPVPVMVFEQALYSAVFFIAVFRLAEFFTRDRKTAVLAAFLLIFAGGFGYLALLDDLRNHSSLLEAVAAESYDNNWSHPTFQVPSVLGTGLLTHRSTTIGFPVLVLALLLFFKGAKAKGNGLLLASGALAGLLFPFSYHAFAALVVLLFIFSLLERHVNWAALFLPLALAVPFALAAFARGAGTLKLFLGWLAPKDPFGFAVFYLANFGVVFILALAALAFLRVQRKRVLAAGLAVMFIIPNVISFTAIEWDMNRFFSFMMLFASVPAAMLLRKLPVAVSAVALALSILSPLLVSAWFVTSNNVALSQADLQAAEWIEKNTAASDVFVTETFINQPTDVAGRLRLLTFTPYVRNYALDPTQRETDTQRIYCGSPNEAYERMRALGATYILHRGGPNCDHSYRLDPRFQKVFSQQGIEIYKLTDT